MRWNLRATAARAVVWSPAQMRARLAEAGLEVSAVRMTAMWQGTATRVRPGDLDVIRAVLDCDPSGVLARETRTSPPHRPCA